MLLRSLYGNLNGLHKDVYILNLRTYEYVMLHSKMNLANMIKLRTLGWSGYPVLSTFPPIVEENCFAFFLSPCTILGPENIIQDIQTLDYLINRSLRVI